MSQNFSSDSEPNGLEKLNRLMTNRTEKFVCENILSYDGHVKHI